MGSMNGFASIAWRIIKWATRGLLALIALAAITWSVGLYAGSMRLQKALEDVKSDPTFVNPVAKTWDPAGPGDNGGPYFAAAFALHRYWGPGIPVQKILQKGWAAATVEEQAKLRSWLESKKPAFDLAAEGARRPWCRFVRSWTSNPWEVHAPEVGGVAFLGGSLVARAEMQAADGDSAGARDSIRLAFAVADSLKDDPPRECVSFRLGLHEQIMKSLLNLIPATLTIQECEEWLALLPNVKSYDRLLERAYSWDLHVLVDLLSGPLDRFWHAWAEAKHKGGWRGGFQRRLADPLVKLDGVRALDELRRIHEVLRAPYPEARAELRKMWSDWHDRSRGWNPVRAVFVIPSWWHLDRVQMTRALATLLKTGLEWEKTRIETGKYPDRCDVIDPLSGEPLVLESTSGRLTSKGLAGSGINQPIAWIFRQ